MGTGRHRTHRGPPGRRRRAPPPCAGPQPADPDAGKKPMMADHAPDVGGAGVGRPSDPPVPRPQLPGCGPEADPACRGAASGPGSASGRRGAYPGGWCVAIIASRSRRSSVLPTGETGPRSCSRQASPVRHRTGRRARRSGTLRGGGSSRPTRSASAGSTFAAAARHGRPGALRQPVRSQSSRARPWRRRSALANQSSVRESKWRRPTCMPAACTKPITYIDLTRIYSPLVGF